MPKAIADASTLIHLAGIQRLALLSAFYDKVLITPAVWREVVMQGWNLLDASGAKVANGVYLYVVRAVGANEQLVSKVSKLAIIK